MIRYCNLLVFALLTGALSGCSSVSVQALHEPFYPSRTQQVTFTADAQSMRGVARIEIVERTFGFNGYCAAYVAGECKPLRTFSEKTVKTCLIEPAENSAQCKVTVGPFGDGSLVTYGARAKDTVGGSGEDLWIGFSVGVQSDPNEPVAVYTRANRSKAIDVVMVPVGYNGAAGRTFRDFVNDSRQLVVSGYLAHSEITTDRSKWNFYVNPISGGLTQVTSGGVVVSRSMTQPPNWTRISAFADAAAYVHNVANWRDFANFGGAGGVGQFTIQAGTSGTIVHETGHAVFGLSDEYCCDGGVIAPNWPHDNLFTSLSSCQTSATAHGVSPGSCTQLGSTNGFCGGRDSAGNAVLGLTNRQWRQDIAADLMSCGANNGAAAGVLDAARIRWFYSNY